MELPRVSASTGARGRGVCLRVVVGVCTILMLPAEGRALNAALRWTASTDPRVQGYNVYVREATHPYGAPRNVGQQGDQNENDGSVSWRLTGLIDGKTYFVAVTAYTGTGLESSLSNELPIGTPNPCVRDQCTAPTQCTLQALPDGSSCGPPGATCGATCLAGVCAGLADRVMTVDRMRVKAVRGDLKIMAKGSFVTSAAFDPMSTGLQLTLADPNGGALVWTTLAPGDLLASRDGGTIKSASRRGKAAGPVKRLLFRTRDDVTKWKAQLVVSPAPGGLPSGVTLAVQAGDLCVSAEAPDCQVRSRALTCR